VKMDGSSSMRHAEKPRICIVEPAHSHEEVILPQVELLRRDFEVFVVAPASLFAIDLLSGSSQRFHALPFHLDHRGGRLARAISRLKTYAAIRRLVHGIAPDAVVFNSTYGLAEVALIHLLFRKYTRAQIIHNFQKFLSAAGRRLYKGFHGNLVISEQVREYVVRHHPSFSDLEYFLPVFFGPDAGIERRRRGLPDCPERKLQLTVIGSVEERRRNYQGLLDAVRSEMLASDRVSFHVSFVGKTPESIASYIEEHALGGHISYWTEYVPFKRLFEVLAATDLVLYLVDREVENIRYYNRYKTTATSLWVKGFQKVGAASTDFLMEPSLEDKTLFYEGTDVRALLQGIDTGKISLQDVQARAVRFEGESIFSFDWQRERLVRFLDGIMSGKRGGRSGGRHEAKSVAGLHGAGDATPVV